MPAKYALVYPKRVINTNNGKDNTSNAMEMNDKNPVYRLRKSISENKASNESESRTSTEFIYPSSYLPDFLFTNTCSHPFLIFYNLNDIFKTTKNGSTFPENENFIETTIIDELNKLFDENVLSFAKLKVDLAQVSDTWNKRFPNAKSNLFSPVQEGFKVKDISDIKSLHFLGYMLNISIYLIFPVGNKYLYNMKLGPDVSDNDVHFKVFFNVNKSKIDFHNKNDKNNEQESINTDVFRKEKWLSFQLIKIGKFSTSPINLVPFGTNKVEGRNILFLEMEKRDPIPIIKIPQLPKIKEIEKVTLQVKEVPECTPNISFKYDSKSKNIVINASISNEKEKIGVNKIKSIATSLTNKKKADDSAQTEKERSDDSSIMIAETNESAFLVSKIELKEEENTSFDFLFGQPFAQDDLEKNIRSYNRRLKNPLTFECLISKDSRSNHPLLNLMCLFNLTNIMLRSTEIIDERTGRDQGDTSATIRAVPIEDDNEVYFSFKLFDSEKDKENWKKITQAYPAFLAMGQNHSYDKKYKYTLEYNNEDSKEFTDFYRYVNQMWFSLFDEVKKIRVDSERAIDLLMNSDVGLNPILCPVIEKEYTELSRSNCIYYYSCQKYEDPLNTLLLQNVQSVNEVVSRTTVDLFKVDEVVRNVEKGIFPVKIQTLIKKIEDKKDQRIPDPPFYFIEPNDLVDDIRGGIEVKTKKPKYQYTFYPIEGKNILNTSKFTIFSKFKIKFLYVSQDNVFAVAKINSNSFSYGFCKAIDTEIIFSEPHPGIFRSAIYLENDKCLLISYLKNKKDEFEGKICFTGYDEQGQINEFESNQIKPNSKFSSFAVLSRTYFAAQIISKDGKQKNKQYCVCKYNSQKRIVEICNYKEHWRTNDMKLFKDYIDSKLNKSKCFIGNRSLGKDQSTLCIYVYDEDKKILVEQPKLNLIPDQNDDEIEQPELNFILDQNDDDGTYDDDIKNLERRIDANNNNNKSDNRNMISSMLNCVPIDEDKETLNPFDIKCSICEIFPSPIAINGNLISCSDDQLSLYCCDYKVYRFLPHQISGFYTNTFQRMSLFSTEMLLRQYKFSRVKIAVIIDTAGIGARFSNLFFGTRFEQNQIIDDEVWSGFSYFNDVAYIVLLFHVKDVDDVFNTIQTRIRKSSRDFIPSLFVCQNDGVKNYIKFGYDPKIIITPASSKAGNAKCLFSFVNNIEFEDQVVKNHSNIININNKEKANNDANTAILSAKKIVTQYLTFNMFNNYPLKTVQKYSELFQDDDVTDLDKALKY